jgi:hypothetical protein
MWLTYLPKLSFKLNLGSDTCQQLIGWDFMKLPIKWILINKCDLKFIKSFKFNYLKNVAQYFM